MMHSGRLVLEDGTTYDGICFGGEGPAAGEVVFNTGMVGYPEALTDPSYSGQILVLTYPLVGNYGVPAPTTDAFGLPLGFESEAIQVAGLVVWEQAEQYSHAQAVMSLHQWLAGQGIPALHHVDTRSLTRRLREHGTMLGAIEPAGTSIELVDPNAGDLVAGVSPDQVVHHGCDNGTWDDERPTVVVLDCGCKASIVRSLLQRRLNVIRVPHDHYFLGLELDGLLISNGPGDPKRCRSAIRNVERALALGVPILGICLGNQLLALAAGAETYKLRFGHRGQNQPCIELNGSPGEPLQPTGRCLITSQNHGYAVRRERLPEGWREWFVNANDGTVEGIRHTTMPLLGVQFHPEASPGPADAAWIFDHFTELVERRQR
jgi:carbamoyl-phosphate synthase small subunit